LVLRSFGDKKVVSVFVRFSCAASYSENKAHTDNNRMIT
jgi:hypothetical protein